MEQQNDIDQLFKRGLQDPEIPFNEQEWEKMSRKLDGPPQRRRIPVWLYTASGIAAALLLMLGWFLSVPVSFPTHHNQVLKNLPAKDQSVSAVRVPLVAAAPAPDQFKAQLTGAHTVNAAQLAAKGLTSDRLPARDNSLLSANGAGFVFPVNPATDAIPGAVRGTGLIADMAPAKAAVETDSAMLVRKANALAQSKDAFGKVSTEEITRSVQRKMNQATGQGHSLVLSAMAAPDITTAESSKPAKVSTNLGMLATYPLGTKFSITSGAIYAKKYYNSGGTDTDPAYGPGGASWEVKADCNVLDIPLNVNYKLLSRKNFSLSVNTGLSSYFMLKEKYEFITSPAGQPQQISNLEVNNRNQHLFGVANVSVSVDHQISPRLSVGVQPFAKLPLTGIGNGNVNLRSTGLSFSLNIGLFPEKKTGRVAANRYSPLSY